MQPFQEYNSVNQIISPENKTFYKGTVEIIGTNYGGVYRPYQLIEIVSNSPPVSMNHFIRIYYVEAPEGETYESDGITYPYYLFLTEERFSLFDKSGSIFSYETKTYSVFDQPWVGITDSTSSPCTEYELLCGSENYPGWECVPIEPIANRLSNIRQQLKENLK